MASSREIDNGNRTPGSDPPSRPLGASASRGRNSKRNIDETLGQNSPVRRSKRLKPGEARTVQPVDVGNGEKAAKHVSRASFSRRRKQEKAVVPSLKAEVNEEAEWPASAMLIQTEQLAQEPEEKPADRKIPRKRKTKEEKEAEMQPLAARASGLRMFVGAHVSAAKGVFNAITNNTHIGGNAFALFLKSQRKWDNPPLQDDHAAQFRHRCLEHRYDSSKHILPHGSYLVNLAQEDKAKAKQAYDAFLDDLRRCEALGITLYNFHPGSANQSSHAEALNRLAKALTNALSATSTVVPVLETMCGHGTTIGGSLKEFGDLLALMPVEHHPRIGICIDTCHSFAAGYDLVSPDGFKAFMKEFDELIGLKYLRALHLNDSKAPRGSKRDLHANIGTGFLGLRAFHNVMNEPRFEDLPLILETPIDRPVDKTKNGTAEAQEDEDNSDVDSDSQKSKKTKAKKPAASKPRTVPDLSVWAREIKLLESLIGMDPDGDEFRRLEADLAEEGRVMRQKHQEQYERKLEAEEKKNKGAGKKRQKNVADMMKVSGRKTSKSAQASDSEGE